jgi:hypothetical protein
LLTVIAAWPEPRADWVDGDISKFGVDVRWQDLRDRRRTPEPEPKGYTNRWYVSSIEPGQGVDPDFGSRLQPTYLGRVDEGNAGGDQDGRNEDAGDTHRTLGSGGEGAADGPGHIEVQTGGDEDGGADQGQSGDIGVAALERGADRARDPPGRRRRPLLGRALPFPGRAGRPLLGRLLP